MPPSPQPAIASGIAGWSQLSSGWRESLMRVALAVLVLFVAFLPDWSAMAHQWWHSSTYNHVLLVPAIVAWLVWQRHRELSRIEPSPWWPALLLAAGALFLWVLGSFAGLSTARQLGVVGMLIATILTLLGPRVGLALAFPLGYLLFLVPVGDEFVPALQMVTASITIALVHLSGIPATIDGVFIDTPAGLFEVAEACSGVKFLVAMIAFGVLVANVCFVSWRRRATLLLACFVVPVLANGVRAWGTIYAAQFFGVEVAAGFDHIVYGWFFFAIVMAVMIAGSWRFFDRDVDEPAVDADAINRSPLLGRMAGLAIRPMPALALLALLFAGGQAWARAADRLEAPLAGQVWLPPVPGWHRIDYAPAVWWEPRATGASHRLLGSYEDEAGNRVDVFLAVYAAQGEGREAGGAGQGALTTDSAWSWQAPGAPVDEARTDQLLADGRVTRLAETRYRTGDLTTGSNARLKLANMRDRLLLEAHPTILLILSAEEREGHPAARAIAAFRRSTGPLGPWMDRVAGIR